MSELKPGCLAGREGLVFGCGPSLDGILSEELLCLLESPAFTVAVNFTPAADAVYSLGADFDVNLWRDEIRTRDPLHDDFHKVTHAVRLGEGAVVKIGQCAEYDHYDQVVDAAPYYQQCGAAGHAAQYLESLGCRRITFIGVDYRGERYARFDSSFKALTDYRAAFDLESDTKSFWRELREKIMDARTVMEFVGSGSLLAEAGYRETTTAALLQRLEGLKHAA